MNSRSIRVLAAVATLACAPAAAQAIGGWGTCYQTGVTPGCVYIITYDDGSTSEQTSDAQGRVTRPCNRIIVRIRVGVPGGGCYDAEPIRSGSET